MTPYATIWPDRFPTRPNCLSQASPSSPDSPRQLDILLHDGHSLRVYGAQIRVLEEVHHEGFGAFLQRHDGLRLPSQRFVVRRERDGDFTDLRWVAITGQSEGELGCGDARTAYQSGKRQLEKEQVGGALVSPDLAQGDGAWLVAMGLVARNGVSGCSGVTPLASSSQSRICVECSKVIKPWDTAGSAIDIIRRASNASSNKHECNCYPPTLYVASPTLRSAPLCRRLHRLAAQGDSSLLLSLSHLSDGGFRSPWNATDIRVLRFALREKTDRNDDSSVQVCLCRVGSRNAGCCNVGCGGWILRRHYYVKLVLEVRSQVKEDLTR